MCRKIFLTTVCPRCYEPYTEQETWRSGPHGANLNRHLDVQLCSTALENKLPCANLTHPMDNGNSNEDAPIPEFGRLGEDFCNVCQNTVSNGKQRIPPAFHFPDDSGSSSRDSEFRIFGPKIWIDVTDGNNIKTGGRRRHKFGHRSRGKSANKNSGKTIQPSPMRRASDRLHKIIPKNGSPSVNEIGRVPKPAPATLGSLPTIIPLDGMDIGKAPKRVHDNSPTIKPLSTTLRRRRREVKRWLAASRQEESRASRIARPEAIKRLVGRRELADLGVDDGREREERTTRSSISKAPEAAAPVSRREGGRARKPALEVAM